MPSPAVDVIVSDMDKGDRSTCTPSTKQTRLHPSNPSVEAVDFVAKKRSNKRAESRAAVWSRALVDHKFFAAFTTLLTIWALTGDDLRIIFTEKNADIAFNVIVIFSMAVFALEICLSMIGKSDYPWSFFMILDVIATLTMLLDITWISDGSLWSGDSEDADGSSLRGGRSAKIGAKVARIVRVVRLVRIVKLYKAYYDARLERLRKKERAQRQQEGAKPGEYEDWGDDLGDGDREDKVGTESQIGKKLSDLTIRLLIILILSMLMVLPVLEQEEVNKMPSSADYGANSVWQTFQAHADIPSERTVYENSLLKYVYYHNWFAYHEDQQWKQSAKNSYSQLFWVGVIGEDEATVKSRARNATVHPDTLSSWLSTRASNPMYSYGSMPPQATNAITGSWSVRCNTKRYHGLGISLLATEMEGLHTVECPDDLRFNEYTKYTPQQMTPEQFDDYHLAFYFDLRPFVREESILGLVTTFFVMILLISGSLWFSNGANQLLVQPLEMMMSRVREIRDNPMNAMRMSDEEFKAEQREKARKALESKDKLKALMNRIWICNKFSSPPELMETVVLEKTIIKLGGLLVLGFGEAGANIISQNMQGGDTGFVNAMIPGSVVDCIIGVARVRDFSVATEVLQSKIMTFVNQIAEIVHGVASEFQAAPNRNSGDVFLLVWRVDEDRISTTRLAEMSMMAVAKVLANLHCSPLLAEYRKHPGLQYRLGDNCQVNMSFGLHAGWAIEGAVGSEFKVDASYVSPNVSLAYSVENLTHEYGVSVIASHAVVNNCGTALFSRCRRIDHVHMSGSKEPLELYCLDLDYKSVPVDKETPVPVPWNSYTRFKARQHLDTEKSAKVASSYDPAEALDSDPAIAAMRRRYTVEFFQLFSMGYQNYKEGEWQVAGKMLSGSKALIGCEDGPSIALLRFMESHSFEAPKDWKGIRELTLAD